MHTKSTAITFCFVVLALCSARRVSADVPRLIHYQGKLRAAGGAAVTDTLSLRFRLYDAATSGDTLFDETQPAVAISNGLFSSLIGSASIGGVPDTAFDAPDVYLGVAVGGGPELAPRSRIGSAPMALKSRSAEQLVRPGTFEPRVTVDPTTGHVGVGTASPSAALEVDGDLEVNSDTLLGLANNQSNLFLLGLDTAGNPETQIYHIDFLAGEGQTELAHIDAWTNTTEQGTLRFGTNQIDRLTLDAVGNLGLGTMAPEPSPANWTGSLGPWIHLQGDDTSGIGLRIESTIPDTGADLVLGVYDEVDFGTETESVLHLVANGSQIVNILPTNNVGIGPGTYPDPSKTLAVGGDTMIEGVVESTSGGFKFPDGTIQTTAAVTPAMPFTTAPLTVSVATTGSDTTGDGSAGNPYATLQKALAVVPKILLHNVTISVAAGTYNLTQPVDVTGFVDAGGRLTIQGSTTRDSSRVFNGHSSIFYAFSIQKNQGGPVLSGLHINTNQSYWPVYVANNGGDVRIEKCIVALTGGNQNQGVMLDNDFAKSGSLTVYDCEFRDFAYYAAVNSDTGDITSYPVGSKMSITDSLFTNCATGVQAVGLDLSIIQCSFSWSGGGGSIISATGMSRVFARNLTGSTSGYVFTASFNSTIIYNSISATGAQGLKNVSPGSGSVVSDQY